MEELASGSLTLPFVAPVAGTYCLARSTGGAEGPWLEISRQTATAAGLLTFVDAGPRPKAFYYIRVVGVP